VTVGSSERDGDGRDGDERRLKAAVSAVHTAAFGDASNLATPTVPTSE
jgi:hypothetical protein